jgi:hypothetical protein
MKRKTVFILFLLLSVSLNAQDSTDVASSGIKVTATVSSKEVPLNRSVVFTVQVEWFGKLDRYEISEVENPEVRNFKIMSNASADRRELDGGQLKAVKTFEFILHPEELGMGYIEGVIIKYIDKDSGEGQHLITNRLEVKVIDPVPEPGSRNWIYKWIVLGLFIVGLSALLVVWRKKKMEENRKKAEADAVVPVEENFLNDLKSSVSFDSPDLDIKSAFSAISLLFRKYLSKKYDFSATNEVKEEIIQTLKQNNVSERLINDTDEIISISDIAKFSGGEGDRAELERVFTLVEEILKSNLEVSGTDTSQ